MSGIIQDTVWGTGVPRGASLIISAPAVELRQAVLTVSQASERHPRACSGTGPCDQEGSVYPVRPPSLHPFEGYQESLGPWALGSRRGRPRAWALVALPPAWPAG